MKIVINKTELELLLHKKNEYIGTKNLNGLDKMFAGISFAVPSIFAKYPNFWGLNGEIIKTILIILGFAYAGWGVMELVKNRKNKYTKEDLLNDICDLNQITHPFSIVAIKDTFNNYPNKFLLYYDERWDCKFFFSYRTSNDDNENIKNIKKRLSNELKTPIKSINVKFVTESIYQKYSVSDKIQKMYDHKIYYAKILDFDDELKKKSFIIDGKKFYWMTIQEMENDPDIQKKNLDVVNLVKNNIT